jgi:hypothetical protein
MMLASQMGASLVGVIFISHSSGNANDAVAVRDRLRAEGYRARGKTIFPVLIQPTPFPKTPLKLTLQFQMANISAPEFRQDVCRPPAKPFWEHPFQALLAFP